jgi:hypothetical protein
MALSPADFAAYSRATGTPYPEDPEERAELAPEVLEFRRNQLRAPQEESNLPGILGAVAAGLGAAGAGFAGLRYLAGRPKPTREIPRSNIPNEATIFQAASGPFPETPSSSRIPGPSLESATTPTAIPQSTVDLSAVTAPQERMVRRHGRMVPASTVRRTPTAIPQSTVDLTQLQEQQTPIVAKQQVEAADTGLDQQDFEINRAVQADIDTTRFGGTSSVSLPIVFKRQDSPLVDAVGTVLPVGDSLIAKLNRNKTRRQLALNQARATLGLEQADAPLPEGFSMVAEAQEGGRIGELAAQKLREAKERRQNQTAAPISQQWQELLFDESGLLNKKVIAQNLGDEKVFPKSLADLLTEGMSSSSSIQALRTGNFEDIDIDPAIHAAATQHVKENVIKYDDADSIKSYLLGGGAGGEYQSPSTKGFGYTGTTSMSTQVISVSKKGGEETVSISGPRTSSRRTRSDLEPLFFDPDTNTLISKSDIGATQSSESVAGSGIGEEVGQAVAFVPRKEVAGFVSLPGVSASGPEDVAKAQGVGYAFGGVKEYGSAGTRQISPEAWKQIRERRKELGLKPNETNEEIEGMLARARGTKEIDLSVELRPLFSDPRDALKQDKVKLSKTNQPYLRIDPLMLQANPGLERHLNSDPQYGNTLFINPATGKNFASPHEATSAYNRFANNLNAKLISSAEGRIEALEKGENLNIQLTAPGNKKVTTALNPNLVVDQVVRRNPKGETVVSDVTLSQAIRNQLLSPFVKDNSGGIVRDAAGLPMRSAPLIQEHTMIDEEGYEGAKYFKQARYLVPEDRTYVDKETGETRASMLGLGDTGLELAPTTRTAGDADTRLTAKNNYLFLQGVNNALQSVTGQRAKVIDDALYLGQTKGFEFLGGPGKNPVLREALVIANTLAQTSGKSRVRVQEPGEDFGLGERYGLGASQSERPRRNVPSGVQLTDLPIQKVVESEVRDPSSGEMRRVSQLAGTNQILTRDLSPEVIGGKRLAAFVLDYTQTSGRPMRAADFNQAVLDLAGQLGANPAELSKEAAKSLRGARTQARVGPTMAQGRRALLAMDRPSPAEEVAQTIAEYDFGETIGTDIERALQGPTPPLDVDMELTARQAQRSRVEPAGSTEQFTVDDQMLSGKIGQLMAQAGRRAGKRRNR